MVNKFGDLMPPDRMTLPWRGPLNCNSYICITKDFIILPRLYIVAPSLAANLLR